MNVMEERSWMYNRRKNGKFSLRFMRGLEEFLDFARKNSMSSQFRCPCKKCKNCCYKEPNEIREHLMRKGFVENYYEWEYHQNTRVGTTSNNVVAVVEEQSSNNQNPYSQMVYDAVASIFP